GVDELEHHGMTAEAVVVEGSAERLDVRRQVDRDALGTARGRRLEEPLRLAQVDGAELLGHRVDQVERQETAEEDVPVELELVEPGLLLIGIDGHRGRQSTAPASDGRASVRGAVPA